MTNAAKQKMMHMDKPVNNGKYKDIKKETENNSTGLWNVVSLGLVIFSPTFPQR
jgi:hypothetical protein